MLGRRGNRDEFADLARNLRRARPQPSPALVESVLAAIGSAQPRGSVRRRGGLALAITGLMLVALASFGGVGYAHSVASEAIKKVDGSAAKTRASVRQAPTSAQAQYGTFTPPSGTTSGGGGTAPTSGGTFKPPKTTSKKPSKKTSSAPKKKGVAGATAGRGSSAAGAAAPSGSNLPFTGLALWIPMSLGALLIGIGLLLRGRGRKREAPA